MRSRKNSIVSRTQVHQCALQWLLDAGLLKDHGWLCTAAIVWSVLLRAAARTSSVLAACRDMAFGPSQQAVFDALRDGLPRTLPVLEKRLNDALLGPRPSRLRRRCWPVAIDWHLVPYYGEPAKSRNEIYFGQPRQGTGKFHAYATACVVQHGQRYTLALTWVRRHESTVVVLRRLLTRIREIGVKIKYLLLDRAFFTVPVMTFLQEEKLPFLMPVMFRGRRSKRPAVGSLRWIERQKKAGWYQHTAKTAKGTVTVPICLSYTTYHHRKTKKRQQKKLLFAAWRTHGSTIEIRERYRKRFGIETSFRQMRQAKIHTCTRNPHLRLLFIGLALILRNLWVWLHETQLADGRGPTMTIHLERLRFRQLLDWIAQAVASVIHDGSEPCVEFGNTSNW
jgi:hypothetical protein